MPKKHLPMFGVGPIFVIILFLLTLIFILLTEFSLISFIRIQQLELIFTIVGFLFIIFGIFLWINAVIISKINISVTENKLITTGIYSYVRNPVYSAFLFLFTGIILIYNNILLFFLPFIFWLFLTILMKETEEKWLLKMYGEEYKNYCKKVNRCIPNFKKYK